MNPNPLVSVIIPTFNRAHLIGETLDSVLAQTYTNWECIVVDDGSTDNTEQVVLNVIKEDSRFRIFKRLKSKPKGANTCRNIGLAEAKGDYVMFFDSDDVMTPDHLDVKMQTIFSQQADYIITKSQYLNGDHELLDKRWYNNFKEFKITPYNYVSQKVNWLTPDICIKRELAQAILFNPILKSGQEYNYFSKLVHISTNGIFINTVTTFVRLHDTSIRGQLNSKSKHTQSYCLANWYTYLDLEQQADKETRLLLLKVCLQAIYKEQRFIIPETVLFLRKLVKELGCRGFYCLPMVWSHQLFGKGYLFRKALFKAFQELP